MPEGIYEPAKPEPLVKKRWGSPSLDTKSGLIVGSLASVFFLIMLYLLSQGISFVGLCVYYGGAILLLYAVWWCWYGWILVFRHGALTWMRLAKAPAKLIATGNRDAAATALAKAVDRAQRFSSDDPRRALMLVELTGFLRDQGRYREETAFYEEGLSILSKHLAVVHYVSSYLLGSISYACSLIDLKRYSAAQLILERAYDLTLNVRKREQNSLVVVPIPSLSLTEFLIHICLAGLLVRMSELAEAGSHIHAAHSLISSLPKKLSTRMSEHWVQFRAWHHCESGEVSKAWNAIQPLRDRSDGRCFWILAKVQLRKGEPEQAEEYLRKLLADHHRRGTSHRPACLDANVDLAEALFGQAKHDDAFASFAEARAIVAHFALPANDAWRKALATWLQRAKDLGRTELAASLEKELAQVSATPMQAITILEKFRIQPPASQ